MAVAVAPVLGGCASLGGSAPGPGSPWGAEPRSIDVEQILLGPGDAVVSFADLDPVEPGPVALRCGLPVAGVEMLTQGGEPLEFRVQGPVLLIDPRVLGWKDGAGLHRVRVRFGGAVDGNPRPAYPILPPDPSDRVDHVTQLVHGNRVERSVILGTPRPGGGTADDGIAGEYIRACERMLLVRRPRASAVPAAAWFGDLVAVAPGDAGGAIAALPRVLASLWDEERPGALGELDDAGVLTLGPADSWAVSRHLALRERVGAGPYLAALRELVDRHRGRGPVTAGDLAAVFEELGSVQGAVFARTWLAGPGRARVKISTRHDAGRGRVLVRVDQVQPVDRGGVAAYPFGLPVRVVVGGEATTHVLEVGRRRELLELPAGDEPSSIAIDPDGSLTGMVELVEEQ